MKSSINLSREASEYLLRLLKFNYAEQEKDFESYNSQNKSHDEISQALNSSILRNKIDIYDEESDAFPAFDNFNEEESLKKESCQKRITRPIFCGAGNSSKLQVNELHKRLDYAINYLSGMQQNGGMGSEYNAEEDRQCKQKIMEVIEDVAIALGAKPKVPKKYPDVVSIYSYNQGKNLLLVFDRLYDPVTNKQSLHVENGCWFIREDESGKLTTPFKDKKGEYQEIKLENHLYVNLKEEDNNDIIERFSSANYEIPLACPVCKTPDMF